MVREFNNIQDEFKNNRRLIQSNNHLKTELIEFILYMKILMTYPLIIVKGLSL